MRTRLQTEKTVGGGEVTELEEFVTVGKSRLVSGKEGKVPCESGEGGDTQREGTRGVKTDRHDE